MFKDDQETQEETQGGFDPEANLFDDAAQNRDEDEDDGFEDDFEERSLDEFDDVDHDDEDEDEDEEERNALFNEGEDEDEDEEESNEFSQKELDVLNKKLGTDYKSVDELKKEFGKSEKEAETEKEENEYKVLSNRVSLYEKYIGMDDERLIREQLLSTASQEKKDITDADVLEEIEEKIQGLVDLNQLKAMAETLRTNLQFSKEKDETLIGKIEDKRSQAEREISAKNTDDLQNAFTDIFTAGKFLGVDVTKEAIHRAYESVRTNKFFDSINNNQEMIAKFAMFVEHEKEISKSSNRPTHSDKTKDAFNFLSGNDKKPRRSIAQANGSASSGSTKDNLMNFLK